jgi:16S rRNA (adenine1518-N6/adenine1519-N6)-dimethyltransferase
MVDQHQQILNLPSISDTLREHGFFTKKSLGQNFIFDLNVTTKIVRHAGDLKGRVVIEVGPGVGSLSRPILLAGPEKLIVIEKDARTLPILAKLKEIAPDQFEIISEDALNIDYKKIKEQYNKPIKIIANLPYNVGTELLLRWLENAEMFESLTLMFQREVAERICAKAGSEHYGRLSIIAQILCDCKIQFDVAPTVFFPPPKVFSSVVSIIPYPKPKYDVDLEKLKKVTRSAFSQRRKSIRNSLKEAFGSEVENVLAKLDIDSNLRAENLTIEQFCALARILPDTANHK